MANFGLIHMDGRCGVATNTAPLTYTGTIQAEEMSLCYVVIRVSAASAGIGALSPAVVKFQTTFDDGATWSDIIGTTIENITGTGDFFCYLTSGVIKIAPQIRVTVTPPAGQTVTISFVKKARATEPVIFRAPVAGGGGAGEDTLAIVGNAQTVEAGNFTAAASASVILGWDGTQHREIACDASGNFQISVATNTKDTQIRNGYSTTNVTTAAWVQLVASTAHTIRNWSVYDSSGQTMYLSSGAAGAEDTAIFAIVPPGGLPNFDHTVASGARISVKAVSGTANAGVLVVNGRGS